MKINISTKLRDFTKKFKVNEETYMNKYKELVGEETKYNNDNNNHHSSTSNNKTIIKISVNNDNTHTNTQ